jgi:thiol-disulfide isomerase/thioredoxin
MNRPKIFHRFQFPLSLGLALITFRLFASQTPTASLPVHSSTNEFERVSQSVIVLLQSRDAARFAKEMTASAEDWRAVASLHAPEAAENLKSFTDGVDRERQKSEAEASAFLAKADALHLDFSKGDLHQRVVNPRFLGSSHYPTLQAEDDRLPFAPKVEIVLNSSTDTNNGASGKYKIVLRRLNKFPNGWRSMGGIQWESFPANVGDEKTRREMAILEKAANFKGVTGNDDPALLRLGQALVRFIGQRDTNIYAAQALENGDLYWAMMQKKGEKGPSLQALNKEIKHQTQKQIQIAQTLLNQDEIAGINLNDAQIEIQEVSIDHLQPGSAFASVEGLRGGQFKLKLAIKTDAKSKTGTSLSGIYILAIDEVMRFADDWRAEGNIRWYQLPAGVLDAKAAAEIELENYVAEHRSLPPGTVVPEIEFTTLDEEKKMKLSDLRGKVVVLDFWATWCGPCQGPMADLQKLRQAHSNWADKVAIVPLSIDDTLDIVRRHVNKRDWTNTFNVWAGDGGWQSAPAKAFRVTVVPTTYVIDPLGRIVIGDHPASMKIDEEVEAALHVAKD